MRMGHALAITAVVALSAGALSPVAAQQTAPKPAAAAISPAALPVDVDSRFRDLVADIEQRAGALGLSARTTTALDGLVPDPEVVDLSRRQPEFNTSIWDYLGRLVSVQRIVDGQQKLTAEERALADVEAAFAVDRHVVLAIWGVESNYGAAMGERRILRSLATLAAVDERRGAFWRGELVAALRILERGDTTAERFTGSWAGAMGHTQFMPSTYAAHAIDFDGDGRRDIWGSVVDALASTAKYLKTSGWRGDRPCLVEVALPQSFDYALAQPGTDKTFTEWAALGVKPAGDGTTWPWVAARRLPGDAALRMLLPAGARGPAFLVTQNFNAVLRYNQSIAYALAVCHLADRLAGGGALVGNWPMDDPPLSRMDREDLQKALAALGYDVGPIDGLIGGKTQAAVRAYQRSRQLPPDGYASQRLLERLRQEARL